MNDVGESTAEKAPNVDIRERVCGEHRPILKKKKVALPRTFMQILPPTPAECTSSQALSSLKAPVPHGHSEPEQ